MRRRQRSKAAGAAAAAAAFLLLVLAAHAASPAAAQPPSQQQLDGLSAQCPVSVRYEMSLGQGQAAAPQVPIFVASLTLQNNENVRPPVPLLMLPQLSAVVGLHDWRLNCCSSGRPCLQTLRAPDTHPPTPPPAACLQFTIDEWRLGWQFPYGSVIKYQQVGPHPPSFFCSAPQLLACVAAGLPGSTQLPLPPAPDVAAVQPAGAGDSHLPPSLPPFLAPCSSPLPPPLLLQDVLTRSSPCSPLYTPTYPPAFLPSLPLPCHLSAAGCV